MLKTTTTKSARNSPSEIAEDAEVGNGTSSITRSAEISLSDMAENVEVGSNCDDGDDETVEKSSSKKSSGPTG